MDLWVEYRASSTDAFGIGSGTIVYVPAQANADPCSETIQLELQEVAVLRYCYCYTSSARNEI